MRQRNLGAFVFTTLAIAGGASTSFAEPPPQLTKMTVVGQSEDRVVNAGTPLRLKFGGSGRCPVTVEISAVGGSTRSATHTQTFDANLGSNEEFTTSFILPPFGTAGRVPLTGELSISALPKGACKGNAQAAIVHTICRGTCSASGSPSSPVERPRITLNPNIRPSLVPVPTGTASSAPAAPASAPAPTGTSSAPKPPASAAPPASSGSSKPVVPPAPSAPSLPPGVKPATGNLSSMLVPSGSFAEDEAQKIQVKGTGGCALDLHISNKTYGGSFDKTFFVKPQNLANSPSLYNGTHFDTLAEGSYHADAMGKNGCSGTAATDFKVTAKTSTASVKGQPTLTLDKQPKSGNAFSKTKDSNIWFKVTVPSNFKDVQYISCCDVEWDFVNQYGEWEVLPTSPFTDPGLNPMANGNQASFRSVSGFVVPGEGATKWRMRVKGTKFKTAFEWSDWLEFNVSQN